MSEIVWRQMGKEPEDKAEWKVGEIDIEAAKRNLIRW